MKKQHNKFITAKPLRFQRLRSRGWKKPDNSVYVGRPGKWGNPIIIVGDMLFIDASYRRTILNPFVILDDLIGTKEELRERMLWYYEKILKGSKFNNRDLQYWSNKFKANNLEELRGKNLLCWCKLSEKCHADILIKLANDNS